jgi:hypothetical protein
VRWMFDGRVLVVPLGGGAMDFWVPTKVDESIVWLDAVMFAVLLSSLVLALRRKGHLMLLTSLLLLGVIIEQLSIQLGATHCHAPGLINLTPCSSLNSVFYYGPWMYLALLGASALGFSGWSQPSAVATLQLLWGLVYEMQGDWMSRDETQSNGTTINRAVSWLVGMGRQRRGWRCVCGQVASCSFFRWAHSSLMQMAR